MSAQCPVLMLVCVSVSWELCWGGERKDFPCVLQGSGSGLLGCKWSCIHDQGPRVWKSRVHERPFRRTVSHEDRMGGDEWWSPPHHRLHASRRQREHLQGAVTPKSPSLGDSL